MTDEPAIDIADDGSIVATAAARARLATQRGRWRPLAQGGELIVLVRADREPRAGRGIHFLGAIDGTESLLGALHSFSMSQENGSLHIESDGAVRTLFLHRGKLLSARSNRPQDRLGEILVAEGWVTREQVDMCFRDGADADLLGRSLLRRGLLTNHQIYEALHRQTQSIVNGVMMVEQGVYYLVKPLDMTGVPAMLHLDMQELLFEGLRRSDELNHLRSVVPNDHIALAATGAPAPADLSERAFRLLSRLDGRATLAQLADVLGLDVLASVQAAAELLERGLCREAAREPEPVQSAIQEAATQRARAIIEPYERALQVVLAAISPAPGRRRRELVAVFLESTESFTEILREQDVSDDGAMDASALIARAAGRGNEGLELLRRCLHELLFFLLFEVGQRGEHELLERLHREIAEILARRPAAAAIAS